MNNWRLLLLAVVVVVQPIGSFTESNLIDGRECCERRSTQDERLHGYRKNQDRHLNSADGIREERHYESYRGPVLIRSETESFERNERRISSKHSSRDTSTIENRLSKNQDRHRAKFELRGIRESRENQNPHRHESRRSMGQNERNAKESRNRESLDTTRTFRLSKDAVRDTRFVNDRKFRSPNWVSQGIEDRRIPSIRKETANILKREDIAHLDTRHERLRTSRFERIELDDNKKGRDIDRRTREDFNENKFSRPSNNRIDAIRDVREQRTVEKNEGNSRRYRDAELEKQRGFELRDRISAVRSDSERISANTMRDSRADVRDRVDARNANRIAERRQHDERTNTLGNFEQLQESDLQMTRKYDREHHRESRDARFSGATERDARDFRTPRSREIFDVRKSSVAGRDVRGSSEERRQNRENSHLIKGMRISSLRTTRESSERMEQFHRKIRESDERSDRTNTLFRENQVRASTERQETRRIVSPSRTNKNSRSQLDSSIRSDIRNHERSNIRRQVLERDTELNERTIRMARVSTSTERRVALNEFSRPSRSSRFRVETRTNARLDDRRQTRDQSRSIENTIVQQEIHNAPYRLETSRSPSFRSVSLERAVRNRDVRQNRDLGRSVERTQQREVRNIATPQRLDTHRSSRTKSIQLKRLVRNRAESRENERRESDGDSRKDRDETRNREVRLDEIMYSRVQQDVANRANERVLVELRKENRDTITNSRNARAVTKGEVKIGDRMDSHRQRDVNRANERVLVERRQENRDASRGLRNARVVISREVKMDERMDERRQRDVASRQENRATARYSRTVRDETRKQEMRIESRRAAFRESRIVKDDSASSRNERATRNIEREVRFIDRNMRTAKFRQESRSDVRSNDNQAMERMDRRVGDVNDDSHFRNMDSLALRDTMPQEKSGESIFSWPIVIYTLQGIYLCGLLVQILTENANKTKKRNSWWSSPKNLVKVD